MSISMIKVSTVDSTDIDVDSLVKSDSYFYNISWYMEEEYLFYDFPMIQNV